MIPLERVINPSRGHREGCRCSVCTKNSRLVRIPVEIRRLQRELLQEFCPIKMNELNALWDEREILEKEVIEYEKPQVGRRRQKV